MEPRPELLGIIMKRIRKEERILAIRRAVLLSIILICSVVGIVPAFNVLVVSAAQTGFYEFSSLLFSDFSIVISYWQNFLLILLETLPALSLALFLAVLLTLLESTKLLIKDIKIIKHIYGYR